MADVLTERGFEGIRAVTRAVVGQDSFHGDAHGVEPGIGTYPESCGGVLAIIGEDLGVGEALSLIHI